MQHAYFSLIAQGKLQHDTAQSHAISALNTLLMTLNQRKAWWHFKQPSIQGVYLFGPVGRGKSMLMDLFYQHLTTKDKTRMHFHHFMAQVHRDLLSYQGVTNPLQKIAKQWRKQTQVLCFDEFFVSDIGDAMILANLFKALFSEGLVLVTTSNCMPDELYKNGLQRQRFLPTIALLKQHCQLVSLIGTQDHRFDKGVLYCHYQVGRQLDWLIAHFKKAAAAEPMTSDGQLLIHQREIAYQLKSERFVMFDFLALCDGPRSVSDYMALAQQFSAIYIANVPILGLGEPVSMVAQGVEEGYLREKAQEIMACDDDQARRFIALIDECYDQHVLVVMSAAVDMQTLYRGSKLRFEFARTASRLVEMQTWVL
ncbi:hypothetical protein PULV_a0798 [Pseudoalteromonas ulvae UL12]|uniref:cell division protein ZapE n=1 Tax=Pseudoalteromonas ulvae TaxID=107327 RepID=UPI00186B72A7|nr:cell division protein ZapE [Pseudoalteromonas ulvae]MBE0363159.1 hypothetical protein [Pseudoalteromonas ulvae UL12]